MHGWLGGIDLPRRVHFPARPNGNCAQEPKVLGSYDETNSIGPPNLLVGGPGGAALDTPVRHQDSAHDPEPARILSHLIRFDTRNPPGNERACISYIKTLLDEAGFETAVVARDESRPNLICRIHGDGRSRPFLMYGHVDVVPTTDQVWQVPPLEGQVQDGVVWGRGAIDTKGPLAMMISSSRRSPTRKRAASLGPSSWSSGTRPFSTASAMPSGSLAPRRCTSPACGSTR